MEGPAIAAGLAETAARLDGLELELHDTFTNADQDRAALRHGFPGLRLTLFDQFSSADGSRTAFRFGMRWHNTGTFFGLAPTGNRGAHAEFHSLRLSGGRIVEQVVTDISYSIPQYELTVWQREYPTVTEDPAPCCSAAAEKSTVYGRRGQADVDDEPAAVRVAGCDGRPAASRLAGVELTAQRSETRGVDLVVIHGQRPVPAFVRPPMLDIRPAQVPWLVRPRPPGQHANAAALAESGLERSGRVVPHV